MKVYLDLVFLLNFSFDFLLLMTVSVVLKTRCSIKRIVIASLFGAMTIFTLFIDITSIELFFIKLIVSIIMSLVAFTYKGIKYLLKNIGYLYMIGFVLGGFMYYLNIEFSYKQEGLIFYYEGLSINFIFLMIFSPIILYIYIKQGRDIKKISEYYYKVKIFVKNKVIECTGYLDTGNSLIDPYFHKPIIIINKDILKCDDMKCIYVPIYTVNDYQNIRCYFVDKIEIDGIGIRKKVLLGISNKKIELDGVDMLLQRKLLEG